MTIPEKNIFWLIIKSGGAALCLAVMVYLLNIDIKTLLIGIGFTSISALIAHQIWQEYRASVIIFLKNKKAGHVTADNRMKPATEKEKTNARQY